MASTIQLARTIAYAQQFIYRSPLTFAYNTNNDPALSNADWVKQTILAPPFAWRWNRSSGYNQTTPTFATQTGVSDYKVALSDFGWVEKAVAYDTTDSYAAYELQNGLIQGADTQTNQPTRIAAQYDDDAGNVTFRVFSAPDVIYNVVVDYQKSASLFTATTNTWAPIPDYLSYLVNQGYLAMTYQYFNDPRWLPAMQLFYQMLADRGEGLDQTQKNLWLHDKMVTLRETQAVQSGKR